MHYQRRETPHVAQRSARVFLSRFGVCVCFFFSKKSNMQAGESPEMERKNDEKKPIKWTFSGILKCVFLPSGIVEKRRAVGARGTGKGNAQALRRCPRKMANEH
jgi:hypothetical protein